MVMGGCFSCTPHENPPPITGTVALVQLMKVDSGGPVGHRESVPVLAVHLRLVNPGAEVRLLGYRYETEQGIVSEALMNKRLIEESRSRLGRLVRFGLPTVFPAGQTTDGWVFFRTSDGGGRIHLSLRDVYGRFSALFIPLPQAGSGKDNKAVPAGSQKANSP
jgi:hypothetical protein